MSSLIEGARARGLDVTTEAYPYEAGMSFIKTALFNPGWQEKFEITYHDLMAPETGALRRSDPSLYSLNNSLSRRV